MNQLSQAIILLKSIQDCFDAISESHFNIDHDGNYSDTAHNRRLFSIEHRAKKLSYKVIECLCDDDFLLDLTEANSETLEVPYENIHIVLHYLEEFIDSHHPKYMDDLLSNASLFADQKLYPCAALCIRLYGESAIKNLYPKFHDYRKPTFGHMISTLKNEFGNKYEEISGKATRLDAIVHNNIQKKECTKNEIMDYIEWIKTFESLLYDIKNDS